MLLLLTVSLLFLPLNYSIAYILTINSKGSNIDFGEVNPHDSAYIIPSAAQFVVVSTASNWSLSAQATGDLIKTTGIPKTLPISQLQFSPHSTNPSWTSFTTAAQTIAAGATTTAAGTILGYDYKLIINWTDYPGSYHGTITYTLTTGVLENSFCSPNPFSPNSDGINDTTTIHYYLDAHNTITATILDVNDTEIKSLLDGVVQSAGAQTVIWDGTNAAGTVAAENDYKYLIKDINGITIAAGVITVDTSISPGTGSVKGKVKDASNRQPIAAAVVNIYTVSGNLVSSTHSNSSAEYLFSNLSAGYYYLTAKADYYYPKTSTVFYVSAGELFTYDIYLDHNISLLVNKVTDKKIAQLSDVITYTIRIKNIGYGRINKIKIIDKCPYNFKYIKGTSELNSYRFNDPCGENPYTWEVGDLQINEEKILTYQVIIGIDAKVGKQKNYAQIICFTEKGKKIITSIYAPIIVKEGIFRNYGIIIGKVYDDLNADGLQQKTEHGIGNVNIIMENGISVVTDYVGRYSITGVKSGSHLLMINPNTLPKGYLPSSYAPKLITLSPGGITKLDFALQSDKAITCCTSTNYSTETLGNKSIFLGLAEVELTKQAFVAYHLNTKLKNKYTLISSLDTRKKRKDRLLAPTIPEDYYPIYGDESKVINNYLSDDALFVNLQAKNFDLLYGNYYIDLKETSLSTYNRSLTGARLEKYIPNTKLVVFGADTEQIRCRDDIPARDVCGPYYLSHYPIVDGSERIRIEARDEKNLQIFYSIPKERNKDYVLDYDTGRLIFDKPVAASHAGIKYYIVILYEYIPTNENYMYKLYGFYGRTELYNGLKLGTSYIKERQAPRNYYLYGLAAAFTRYKEFNIKAEYAKTDGDLGLLQPSKYNSAYFIEALSSLQNDKYKLKTFYHQVGANFSNAIKLAEGIPADEFYQYSAEYYNITNLTMQRDIIAYGARFDYQLMTNKNIYVQRKVITEPRTKTRSDIYGIGYQQRISRATYFINFQEENKSINELPISRTCIFTLGNRTVINQHRFGLKYNFIKFDKELIRHNFALRFASQYKKILPTVQYELTTEKKTKPLWHSCCLTIGLQSRLNKSVTLYTSCTFNWRLDYLKNIKAKTVATSIGVNYTPHPRIEFSAINKKEQTTGETTQTNLVSNTVGMNFTPTDKLQLSTKKEIKEELNTGKTFLSDIELKHKISKDLTSSLKYSYYNVKATPEVTGLLIADIKQKFNSGLTIYGKYTHQRTKKEKVETVAKLLLALAYRPPQTNRFNCLAKYEFINNKNKEIIISLESIYEMSKKCSLFSKYAVRHLQQKNINLRLQLTIIRLTYNFTEKIDGSAGYYFLHQRLTNDYKIIPTVELGCLIKKYFKLLLGYNLIDYKDRTDVKDSYSTQRFYLRLTASCWQ